MATTNRAGDLLAEDSYDRLAKISNLKADLEQKAIALTAIEKDLNEQILKSSKLKSAKILLGVGAAGFAVTALITMGPMKNIGDLIADSVLGFAGLSVSTVVTVTGVVKYFLNVGDAKDFAEQARLAKLEIQQVQNNLNHEIVQLCKVDARHQLCY
jgi:hypothetical protein